MIFLPLALLKQIVDAAEAAYPAECCGLLVGHNTPSGELIVTGVEASPNVSGENPARRFEVSPQVRFDVMRALQGGTERIIGHYHSHPEHPAAPSLRDLERIYEPDLVWLITSVVDGQAIHSTAHQPKADGSAFTEIPLHTQNQETNGETP